MAIYVVAQITIHDRTRYERYAARFGAVLAKYQGRLLVADEQPELAQGSWTHDKLVVFGFDDRAALERFRSSDEYTTIARDREAATEGVVLVVRGVSSAPV